MAATLFAGAGIGIGLGLVIQAGASTGGMDIPPLVIEKKLGFPVSVSLYLFDFSILILQIFISDREQVLYGILLVVLYTVILDRLLINGKRQISKLTKKSRQIWIAEQPFFLSKAVIPAGQPMLY